MNILIDTVMSILPTLCIVVVLLLVVQLLLKSGNNKFSSNVDEITKKEQAVKRIRKNLDNVELNYIESNLENISSNTYNNEKIKKKLTNIEKRTKLQMIKLDRVYSNTELKEMFGANNFDKISILETHYNSFIRGLYELALEYLKNDYKDECELALLEAIRLKGDITGIYTTLINLYTNNNDLKKLNSLKKIIDSLDLSFKNKIYKDIN